MKSLQEIEAEVDRRAALIGAAGHRALPTYVRTEDFARPHVEVDSHGYHLVVVERGREHSRFTTQELDDLLFRLFRNITSELAFDHEAEHRDERRDARRLAFRHQIELLERISPDWAARAARHHREILKKYPFDDMSAVRARLSSELREAGHAPDAAWRMACERYPLPEAG